MRQRRLQGQELFEQREAFIRQARGGKRQLLPQAAGDFLRRAAGIGGIAGFLHHRIEIIDQHCLVARRKKAGDPRVQPGHGFRMYKAFQQRVELRHVAECLHQPLLPAERQAKGGNHRFEHLLVAQRDCKRPARQQALQNAGGVNDGTGVGGGNIGIAEILDARLIKLVGTFAALAEDFAEIGITLRRAGRRFDMAQADRDGEFRAQAQALTRFALRHEDTATQILAGHIQKRFGGLDDGRVHAARAARGEFFQ